MSISAIVRTSSSRPTSGVEGFGSGALVSGSRVASMWPRADAIRRARAANVSESATIESTHVQALMASLRGAVIQPGDAAYDEARRVFNGMIDRHPRLIVRCADVADVIASVHFAREHRLTLSVRGGGHNVAGSS